MAAEMDLSQQSLICIVDDDPSFRVSLQRLIRSLGYTVEVFASAADYLAFPKRDATACLVADIHMPDMTGVELYRHLVQSGIATPTILITAYPDDGAKALALTLGVFCYLRKPLEEAHLISCLSSAVAGARRERHRQLSLCASLGNMAATGKGSE